MRMGRHCKVSKEKFLKAYHQNKDEHKAILRIAMQLGLTKAAVYNYLDRYNLDIPLVRIHLVEHDILTAKIFSQYRGQITIGDLATEYHLSRAMIRRCIEQEIIKLYQSNSPPRFPQSEKIRNIKIIKALIEADETGDDELWDDPSRIAEYTGISKKMVIGYLQYAFDQMWKKTHGNSNIEESTHKFSEPVKQKKLTPVEQLKKLCGTDEYKLLPGDKITQLERDQAMAKVTLKGKEHLTPVDQLRELMNEYVADKIADFQNEG